MAKPGGEEMAVPEKAVTLRSQVRGTPAPRGKEREGLEIVGKDRGS